VVPCGATGMTSFPSPPSVSLPAALCLAKSMASLHSRWPVKARSSVASLVLRTRRPSRGGRPTDSLYSLGAASLNGSRYTWEVLEAGDCSLYKVVLWDSTGEEA
jgi:hypothetical protein